jgi:hypothetical protein
MSRSLTELIFWIPSIRTDAELSRRIGPGDLKENRSSAASVARVCIGMPVSRSAVRFYRLYRPLASSRLFARAISIEPDIFRTLAADRCAWELTYRNRPESRRLLHPGPISKRGLSSQYERRPVTPPWLQYRVSWILVVAIFSVAHKFKTYISKIDTCRCPRANWAKPSNMRTVLQKRSRIWPLFDHLDYHLGAISCTVYIDYHSNPGL